MKTLTLAVLSALALAVSAHAAGKVLPLSLTLNSTNSGTISLPGQQDRFTFTGSAGQWVLYDALDLDFDAIAATLYAPSGGAIFSINSSSDTGPLFLGENGTYTLVLDGVNDATNDYSFRLLDLANAVPIGYGTNVAGQLTRQSGTAAYRFDGTAGQRVGVTNIAASSGNANWRLLTPANGQMFYVNIQTTPGEFVLPMAGTYILLVEGTVDTIGNLDYVFRVSLMSNPSGGTSGFGTVRSGTTTADQTNVFTYTAPAGTYVFVDALTDSSPVTAYLFEADGQLIAAFGLTSDSGPYFFARSGSHRLEVVGSSDGDYNFRLMTGAGATNLAFGTTYTQTPAPGMRTDYYRVTATAGQRFQYDSLDDDNGPVNAVLFHPNGNVIFLNGNASADAGPFTFTEPGTYWLWLQGGSPDATEDYSFRLLDIGQSPSVALTLGSTVNGVLNPGTETDLFRFNGVAGQRLFFDGANTNTGGRWHLHNVLNNFVVGAALSEDFEYVLTQTGTYWLGVIAGFDWRDTNAIPYSIRVLLAGSTTTPLVYGTTYSGTIAQPGDEARYTFSGTPGQRIVYDALDIDGDSLQVYLLDDVGNNVFINQGAESDAGPYTLNSPGQYTLVLRGYGPSLGTFRFRLLELGTAPSQTLTLGTTVEGVLNPGKEIDLYRVQGVAGQRLYFDGAGTNTAGGWNLYNVANSYVAGAGLAGDFEYVLTQSGTYLLLVYNGNADTNPLPYSIRVLQPSSSTNALTLGSATSGSIAQPGNEVRYTFAGTPGQRVYYDALDQDGDALQVYLLDPIGNNVNINQNAESDAGPFTLDRLGTYTLVLRGYGDAAGSFSFRLIDLAAAPAQTLTLGPAVNGVLTPGTEVDWYRFTATMGQRIFFDGADTNTAGSWFLFNAANQGLAGNALSADFEYTVPQSGTYFLAVYHNNPGALPYSIRVFVAGSTTNAYVLGTGVTNTLTAAGEEHRYTFTGTVGQRIFYDALEADFDAINVYLFDPLGNNVFIGGNADSDAGIFTLTRAGTYVLVFRGNGSTTGDYRFRLLDLAAAPAITYGLAVTGQLAPQIEADLYRISGVAGQRLSISNLGASSANANWYLVHPNNNAVLSQNILTHLGDYTLPVSGTYAIAILGTSDLFGALDYQFRVTLRSSSNGTPSSLDVVRTGTTTSGQTNTYTFTGTAGLPIYLDNQTNNGLVCHQLLDPNGEQILYICPGSDAGPYYLPTNGTYTLHVLGQGDGDFRFRWMNLAGSAASNLVFGTTYSQVPPAFRTDVYRFTGASGQRLVYDSLEWEFEGISVRLYDPLGNNVFLSGNTDSEPGPFTLVEAGTYYLVIESLTDVADADYSFRLINAAQAPASALALDTQINGVLDPGTRSDVYRFNGTAGQRLYFDAMPTNGAGNWYLYDPINQPIGATSLSGDFLIALNASGQYLLVVGYGSDTNPQPYSIRVVTSADNTNALTLGTTTSGTLNEPGQIDSYTFAGTAGQRLLYDAWDNDFDNLGVQIITPSGNQLISQNADSDTPPFTLTETGPHVVRFFGGGDTLGDYQFRLIDAAQPPAAALTLDTQVTSVLDPGVRTDVYRITGTAGQRLFMDAMPTNGNASWYLFSPQNQNLGNNGLWGDFSVTLPQSGQYLLVVGYSADTNPVPFSIRVAPVPDNTAALTLGATVNGILGAPGETDTYTFAGTAGQRLVYDALDNDFDDVTVQFIAPWGDVLWQQNSDSDTAPFTLTDTGTYGVRFVSGSGAVADYAFRLLDASSAPIAAYDTVVTNELTNSFGAVVYRVPGLATLRLFVDGLGTPDGSAGYYLYDPDNRQLGSANFGNDFEVVPALTGTHLLVLYSGSSSPLPYSFQIVPGNHAPVLALIGNRSILEESNFTFTAAAADLELPNDVLTWSLDPGAPAGANINPATGVFSWTPTEAQGSNTYTVTVRVRDDGTPSFEDAETFTIIVNEVNKPPVFTGPGTQTINELTALNVTATATDPDIPTNPLGFSLVSGPSGLTVAANGAIAWTPTEAQGPGTYPVSVRVTDSNPLAVNATSLSVTGTFNVVVNEINVPPVFTGPGNQTIVEEQPFAINATATDADIPANPLSYSLISGPGGLTVSPSGAIAWTPSEAQGSNVFTVSVRVTDNNTNAVNTQMLSATNTFTITVLESNRPPVLTVPGTQNIIEETPLNASASATDPDIPSNPITYSLVSPPAGLSINPTSGALTWTPTEAQGSNSYVITVVATDTNATAFNAKSIRVTNTFTIVVNESNRPPVLGSPGTQTLLEETTLGVTLSATDPDVPANSLTYGLVSPPAGMTINPVSGVIAWTPTEAQGPGNFTITITATDTNPPAVNTKSFTVTNTFTVNVLESNKPPMLTGPGDQTVPEQTPLSANATATDPDIPANTLNYALVSGPAGLTVSAAGAINWTPGEAVGPSTNPVMVRVFDNGAPSLSHTQTFQVVVQEVNVAPLLTLPPDTNIFSSSPYTATATATDADVPANVLRFALVSAPPGMTIGAANGVISWTPTEAQAPSTNVIFVSVTDTNPPAINTKSFSVTNSYTVRVIRSCTIDITNQPMSRAAVPGSSPSFAVGALTTTGQTNYQWQFNGTNLVGRTNRTLVITNLQSSGFGLYRAIVNDGTCSVTSAPAALTLAVAPSFYNLEVSGTTVITTFNTEFGPTYVIESKQSLNATNWTVVTTYTGDGTPKTFTIPTQPLVQEFFRIRLE